MMTYSEPSQSDIRRILDETRTIVMVGASANWNRPSYFAMKYLIGKGYRVIPVNPGLAGQELLGELAYASLSEVPGPFEMVDIFRRSTEAATITDQAIALKDEKGIRTVWMQLGVRNEEAAAKAQAAGLQVVMDRCPKIEWGRLHAELAWGGFNTGIISAKRRRA